MEPNQVTNPKQQVVEKLRAAANVLVTVSANPSVDQLAACIGLTLMLNRLGKHATAVFSGKVPNTVEFLRPEETIEKDTNSLRDFIISLDKSKADKLRYKVEENIVKIFITPYRTALSEKDLDFSQGDFNVDAVVALGVAQREQLDQAIMAHGRILHDASVLTVSAGPVGSDLGVVNWQEPTASSLCEMLVSISEAFQGGLLDGQIATAYLTGIVAETARFSNTKTSPKVMTMAAQLMAVGANQQLIATELGKTVKAPIVEKPIVEKPIVEKPKVVVPKTDDGSLTIPHKPEIKMAVVQPPFIEPKPPEVELPKHPPGNDIDIDEQGKYSRLDEDTPAIPPVDIGKPQTNHRVIEPMNSTATPPISLPNPNPASMPGITAMPTPEENQSLTPPPVPDVNNARDTVSSVISSMPYDAQHPEPLQAIGSTPFTAPPPSNLTPPSNSSTPPPNLSTPPPAAAQLGPLNHPTHTLLTPQTYSPEGPPEQTYDASAPAFAPSESKPPSDPNAPPAHPPPIT